MLYFVRKNIYFFHNLTYTFMFLLKKINITILFFLFFLSKNEAQVADYKDFSKIIADLKKETLDSMTARRAESLVLRNQMISINDTLKNEPLIVFGPKNEWINEGMNLLFKSVPTTYSFMSERNPMNIRLENKHVQIFYSDLALQLWKYKAAALDSILNKNTRTTFYNTPEQLQDEIMNEAVKFANNRNIFIENDSNKDWDFWGNKIYFPYGSSVNQKELCLPIPSKDILMSVPAVGQFNFNINEFQPHKRIGRVIFSQEYYTFIEKKYSTYYTENSKIYGIRFVAEWSDGKRTTYTDAVLKLNSNYEFVYRFPEQFFQPNHIYSLKIKLIKPNQSNSQENTVSVSDVFRGKNAVYSFEPKSTDNVTLVFENYFRTSKYQNPFDKLNLLKNGIWDAEKSAWKVELDEPFDKYEIKGFHKNEPILHLKASLESDFMQKIANSNLFGDFFHSPKVTFIDTVNIQKPLSDDLVKKKSKRFFQSFDPENNSNFIFFNNDYEEDYVPKQVSGYTYPRYTYDYFQKMEQSNELPLIQKTNFETQSVDFSSKTIFTLTIPGIKELNEAVPTLKSMIEERTKERAEFFYLLHVRDMKLAKNPWTRSFDSFLEEQKNVLWNDYRLSYALRDLYQFRPQKELNINVNKRVPNDEEKRVICRHSIEISIK